MEGKKYSAYGGYKIHIPITEKEIIETLRGLEYSPVNPRIWNEKVFYDLTQGIKLGIVFRKEKKSDVEEIVFGGSNQLEIDKLSKLLKEEITKKKSPHNGLTQ